MRIAKTVLLGDRAGWRAWLKQHHKTESEVWLIYYKKNSGHPRIPYDDAVEEALCFGWIDSLVQRIDDEKYAQKFTPRKMGSNWSYANKQRVGRLIQEGRMTKAGLDTISSSLAIGIKENRFLRDPKKHSPVPPFVKKALMANPRARKHFNHLAPSYQRLYVRWITQAKKEETQMRRLKEALGLLAQNKKLGLK